MYFCLKNQAYKNTHYNFFFLRYYVSLINQTEAINTMHFICDLNASKIYAILKCIRALFLYITKIDCIEIWLCG